VPRFPLWVLTTFGCGRDVDTLIGDLTEEYRAGRSAIWLWRQTLRGVASTVTAEVCAHPLLMLQAAAVGALVYVLLLRIGWSLYGTIEHFRLIRSAYTFTLFALVGWGVAHFCRPRHKAAIVVCACPLFVRGTGVFVWQTVCAIASLATACSSMHSRPAARCFHFTVPRWPVLFTGVLVARAFRQRARDGHFISSSST